jgi:hypothetical protein
MGCVADHTYCRTLYVTRFRINKNCLTSPRQNMEGEGAQINSGRKVLLQVTFKAKRFCIAFHESEPFTRRSNHKEANYDYWSLLLINERLLVLKISDEWLE